MSEEITNTIEQQSEKVNSLISLVQDLQEISPSELSNKFNNIFDSEVKITDTKLRIEAIRSVNNLIEGLLASNLILSAYFYFPAKKTEVLVSGFEFNRATGQFDFINKSKKANSSSLDTLTKQSHDSDPINSKDSFKWLLFKCLNDGVRLSLNFPN